MITWMGLRRRWASIALTGSLVAAGGYATSRAFAEEEGSKKVLTLQKAKGLEAVVGDKVATPLSESTKPTKFTFGNGAVSCTTSKIEGKIESNPEVGKGNGVIEIESWTFAGCSSTVGGAGGAWKLTKIESTPVKVETESPTIGGGFTAGFNFPLEVGVEIGIETPAKQEITCTYRWKSLHAVYGNGNAELEIDQEATSFRGFGNCGNCPLGRPTWFAEYRPLQDETGVRKGLKIWIN